MRKLAIILMLLCVAFSVEAVEETDSSTLYQPNTDPSMSRFHMRPYLWFEEEITASTTARIISGNPSDLRDGDIICEGVVRVRAQPDGEWAHGGLFEHVNWWYRQCDPEYYGTVNTNQPIHWSTSDYGRFIDWSNCDPYMSCWGHEGGLVTQRVNTYERLGDPYFNDRKGDSNVICKGTQTILRDSSTVASQDIGTGAMTRDITLTRGTHNVGARMDVSGCLGIVRIFYDHCTKLPEGRSEEIFSRTSAQSGLGAPEYSNRVGPVEITLTVVSNDDIVSALEVVSFEPSPIMLGAAESTAATITLRNPPCTAIYCTPVEIRGVEMSGGFRFFRFVTPETPPFVIYPGQTKTYSGSIRAPDPIPDPAPANIDVQVNYVPTEPNCDGLTPDGNIPFEVPYDYEENETITNLIPDIPTIMTVEVGNSTGPFVIPTLNVGDFPSNPGMTVFAVFDPLSPWPPLDLVVYQYGVIAPHDSWDYYTYQGFTCPREGNFTAVEVVDIEDTTLEDNEFDNEQWMIIQCVTPGEIPEDENYTCTIEPTPQMGFPGTIHDFEIRCDGDFCDEADWSISSGPGSITDENDVAATVQVNEDAPTPDEVHVHARAEYEEDTMECEALIILPESECIDYV